MKTQVRLNSFGEPYLTITFSHDKKVDETAEDDVERLFIAQLSKYKGEMYTSHGMSDTSSSTTVTIMPNKDPAPGMNPLSDGGKVKLPPKGWNSLTKKKKEPNGKSLRKRSD